MGVAGCALTFGCDQDLSQAISTDVCASGRQWAGGRSGSEEMYPGRDCIDCHAKEDGPQFFAAGTIYGLIDSDGLRTSQSDCFGLEGALVTLTTGSGKVLQQRTNRAGNFFFEGDTRYLATPYNVVVEYELPDGTVSRQPMTSSPSYGGCARCHRPDARETEGAVAGDLLGVDAVVPAFPIYTGPVTR
jgi:hypothetical protein